MTDDIMTTNAMMMALFLAVILSLDVVDAFTRPSDSRPRALPALAAKSICTFDDGDFAGTRGEWPYADADMNRLDGAADAAFYDAPRFVKHVDDGALASLTRFYREEFAALGRGGDAAVDVLDLCSSWVSHLPEEGVTYGRVAGVGMNEQELAANAQLSEFVVQDLNENPTLSQFADASFDYVCNVVSVDYLTKPLEIFKEMHRVLKPGGTAIMSFSNRCFPTKAINMWTRTDDSGHIYIVGAYYKFSADWVDAKALDITDRAVRGDPMFVVQGSKPS